MKTKVFLTSLITLTFFCSPSYSQESEQQDTQFLRSLLKDLNYKPLKVTRDISSPLYQLGEKLFSDKDLSGNKNISCQTCHQPDLGGGDGLPLSIGEGGEGQGRSRRVHNGHVIPRNAPHLFNLGEVGKEVMFWDGRVSFDQKTKVFTTPEKGINGKGPTHPEYCEPLSSALSALAMFPPLSHEEMRGQKGSNEVADASTNFEAWELLTSRITNKREYQKLLKITFPQTPLNKINFAHLGEALGHFQATVF